MFLQSVSVLQSVCECFAKCMCIHVLICSHELVNEGVVLSFFFREAMCIGV